MSRIRYLVASIALRPLDWTSGFLTRIAVYADRAAAAVDAAYVAVWKWTDQ